MSEMYWVLTISRRKNTNSLDGDLLSPCTDRCPGPQSALCRQARVSVLPKALLIRKDLQVRPVIRGPSENAESIAHIS